MTPADRLALHRLADALTPGTAVSVPREWLLELLGDAPAEPPRADVLPPADLCVADLALRFRRKPSTVRGWLERGRFPGAYKLNERDWRAPMAAVVAFEARQRPQAHDDALTTPVRRGRSADLGRWRQALPPDGGAAA
jgi:hypothetical protein